MNYTKEFHRLAVQLEEYHSIFAQLWRIGAPHFTESIPTACVGFDPKGQCVQFKFNPNFWDKLDDYSKMFVISHECLHVILNHGVRGGRDFLNHGAVNVCLDVVVNHLLVDNFGFERDKVKMYDDEGNEQPFCWRDTVFKDKPNVLPEQSFEYYYNQLDKVEINLSNFDSHDNLGDISDQHDKIIKQLSDTLSDTEKEKINQKLGKHKAKEITNEKDKETKNIQAGTQPGNEVIFVNVSKVAKKKKWETLIRKWFVKVWHKQDRDRDQFVRENRRLAFLTHEFFIPNEQEIEDFGNEEFKTQVYVIMDSSGSCLNLAERFFRAALSIPTERFEVRLLCFDTQVYEVSIKEKKLYGFGGTSFKVVGDYIQKEADKQNRYPDAIWVLTDGYGDNVEIPREFQRNWSWFLTTDYKECIPKDCQIYNLAEFE